MSNTTIKLRVAAVMAIVALLGAFALAAAADQPDSLSTSIDTLLEAAERAVGAQPPPPEEVLQVYGQAKAMLEKARGDLDKIEVLRAELQAAPAKLPGLRAQLEKKPEPLPEPPSPKASLTEVEHLNTEARERLDALETARELADARSRELERRIGEIPDEVSDAAAFLAEARKRLDEPLPADEPVGIEAALILRREAVVRGAEAALRLLDVEREHAGGVGDVIQAELALAERQIDRAQEVEERASEALKAKQREQIFEFLRRAREMQEAFAGRDPALVDLCAEIVVLAEEASGPDGIFARLLRAGDEKRNVVAQLTEIQGDFKDIQARVRLMGRTTGVGSLLIEQWEAMPLGRDIENQLAGNRSELNDAQLQSFQLREESKQARKEGPELQAIMETMGVAEDQPGWRKARRDARKILDLRRELLSEISQSYLRYQAVLSETIAAEQELLKTVEEMTDFYDEQVLWVRNLPPLDSESFRLAGQAISAFSWERTVSEVAGEFGDVSPGNVVVANCLLLALILLLAGRFQMRRRIRHLGRLIRKHPPGTCSGMLETLLWTGLWGLTWPALAWTAAWRLTGTPPNAASTAGLAAALNALGFALAPVCLIRAIALPDGLGADHLGMDRVRLAAVRKAMLWFTLLVLPMVFLSAAMNTRPITETSMSLGRLFTIGGLLLSALLIGILFRREGPLIRGDGSHEKLGLLHRRWWLWYSAAVGLPVLLAGTSAFGYAFSAVETIERINGMILLVLGLVFVRAVGLRGLRLFRRQMIGLEYSKSREAHRERDGESDSVLRKELLREAVGRVTFVSDRTERFVRYLLWALFLVGLYLLWRDALPAFRFLTRTNLYTIGEIPVNLADLLAAVVYGIVAVVAVRTLPGMLEVYLLPRFNVQMGVRSALATFVRYLLTIVGVVSVCSHLGVTWDNIQWIVAALGIGLGFGMQEIVANLFSGFVLLVDGRIRRLDVVTVGDTSGRVTAIRTMATTITDWNNREVVIPNKEFISGRVTNWTLSERTVRLDIPIGVAYGSDTREAEKILIRVGTDNEHTLDDPPPRALFLGFSDYCLQFQLHVWVNFENFLGTKHELHRSIDDAFREAGITIAYPQLDVHLDGSGPK